jgi:uncharacterized protein DUF6875
MHSTFLNPRTLEIAHEILEWAKTFLAAENENMLRKGSKVVCPFVRPSLEAKCFYMAIHPEINGRDPEMIERIMLSYMPEFDIAPPYDPDDKDLKTLLVIFPNIPEEDTNVLDRVHGLIKTVFVQKGMMVGQFHKKCKDPSVHNKKFLASSTSPYPLIAMRYMQVHDIIFLHQYYEGPIWFDEYNRRHGHIFKDQDNLQHDVASFAKLYYDAKERFI